MTTFIANIVEMVIVAALLFSPLFIPKCVKNGVDRVFAYMKL